MTGRDIRIVVMRANNPRRSAEERDRARAKYERMFRTMTALWTPLARPPQATGKAGKALN
ncbi:hypothetical protein ABZ897_53820 [Nonomuraea sp. NPDC046802]|uniref:hypothetical protein n=1 Tax=Nonomuraea sp. NPDC046802 TaxID=3154919 RepID=UPI00340941D7